MPCAVVGWLIWGYAWVNGDPWAAALLKNWGMPAIRVWCICRIEILRTRLMPPFQPSFPQHRLD